MEYICISKECHNTYNKVVRRVLSAMCGRQPKCGLTLSII